jgi:hypothetical protein
MIAPERIKIFWKNKTFSPPPRPRYSVEIEERITSVGRKIIPHWNP